MYNFNSCVQVSDEYVCLLQVDILHPLSSLEWRECRELPVSVGFGAKAVCLKDKIYMRLSTVVGIRAAARLYIYTPPSDTWDTMNTPVYGFVLTTYHSQLVLIGGWEYVGDFLGRQSYKLWTLSEDGQWQEIIPPMELGLYYSVVAATSHGDHLLVLIDDYQLANKLLVFSGHHWTSTNQVPHDLTFNIIKCSTISDGHWYIFGVPTLSGETKVYYASLDTLIASCQPSETPQSSSVWKRLPSVPDRAYSAAVFGNWLIAAGKRVISAYSTFTNSWIEVADNLQYILGQALSPVISSHCAVVLPSNELMVVSTNKAFKARLKSKCPWNSESNISMSIDNSSSTKIVYITYYPVTSTIPFHQPMLHRQFLLS